MQEKSVGSSSVTALADPSGSGKSTCARLAARLWDAEFGTVSVGGERQRISIARALLKDAPIVLLDEATASLDIENKTHVQETLSRLLVGKTVIVIARRMRTVEAADKVVVLDGGHVVEQGAPAQLMEQGGLFARMVGLQRQSAEWTL